MSINFSQFPSPRLPLVGGDIVVGYQIVGGIPTLAQYTLTQMFVGVFPGGIVPVANGGTGAASLTVNGVLVGEGTNPVHSVVGVTGQILTGNTGADPSFSGALPATVTGTTNGRLDNTTLIATDAFVNQQIASATATVPIPLTTGIYNQATLGTGTTFVIFATGGVISSILTVVTGGTGYVNGDLLIVVGGNSDALLRVTNAVGGVIQSGGLSVLYGGTGYTTGATVGAVPAPPGQRSVVLTGVLSGNVTFIIQNGTFLTASRRVQFNNNTTGAFTVTVKLSNGAGGTVGTGVVLPQGTNNSTAVLVQTDGVNDVWLAETAAGIGALSTTAAGRLIGTQVITATGTYTPTAGTTSVIVEVQAGGGGGGGAVATGAGQYSTAAGGCSGSYAKARITSGFSGVTATIGAAGTAGASGTGGTGGTSSFGALVSCPGGVGGPASAATVNTATTFVAASATVGTPTFSGGGTTALATVSTDAGSPAFLLPSATNLISGSGGDSPLGTGGRSVGGSGVGTAGTGNGSGGSGGTQGNASSAAQGGGAGTIGVIIVYEYS